MNSESHSLLDFFFEGGPAGIFQEIDYPTKDGTYSYEPYRSGSHYRLQTALDTSPGQRCYYIKDGFRYNFTVLSCPEYGRLELIEFDTPIKHQAEQSGSSNSPSARG